MALRLFGSLSSIELKDKLANGLAPQLEMAARDACGISRHANVKEEEKKEDSPISTISRQHFQTLRGSVDSTVNDDGERIGGINIQYPDPFAADLVAWLGGSILGTLDYKCHYIKK